MSILGLDIGGANIKAATPAGWTLSVPFPLWKSPDKLEIQLQDILARAPECRRVAVTMTGELADCFSSKSVGVAHIAKAIQSAADDRGVYFWTTHGRFVDSDSVECFTREIAAANWHAQATWLARRAPHQKGLMIDVGSTTTDLIPFAQGAPAAAGRTDYDRLRQGELIYTGTRRTPLCAVARSVGIDGCDVPVAAEWFATIEDVYVWTRDLPELPDWRETADGRPLTREACGARLARMVCCDFDEIQLSRLNQLADSFARLHLRQLVMAIDRITSRCPPQVIIISGSGDFLARRAIEAHGELTSVHKVSLAEEVNEGIATSACAYAVAKLLNAAEN